MACLAGNIPVNMYTVVEINKITQIKYPVPDKGLVRAFTFPDRFQHGCILEKHGMTFHTYLCLGNPGVSGLFHKIVTKSAIDTHFTRMMLMAERNFLPDEPVMTGSQK